MCKKHLWLMIAQTALLTGPKQGLADQVLVELACVPENVLPATPEEMWRRIKAYIKYAHSEAEMPKWFDEEWISDDW